MQKLVAIFGLAFATSVVVGCSGGADGASDVMADEGALRGSGACPEQIEVHMTKPVIKSDRALKAIYKQDWERANIGGDTDAYAASQLDTVQPWLEVARADEAVTLRGAQVSKCTYRTTDADTGAAVDYHVWIKNGDLRVEQGFNRIDSVVFYNAPIKSVSATSVKLDDEKQPRVYAENTSRGHDGDDGFSYYIGNVDVTVKVIP